DEVEPGRGERQLLGVGLLEADGDAALGGLATGLGDHRRREVDAGDAMAPGLELEGQEAGAAPGVERVEGAPSGEDEIEDAVPRRALAGRLDAVAKVLVEVRRPPAPMGGDLALDRVSRTGRHGDRCLLGVWGVSPRASVAGRPRAVNALRPPPPARPGLDVDPPRAPGYDPRA